jgi:hypothetical protein
MGKSYRFGRPNTAISRKPDLFSLQTTRIFLDIPDVVRRDIACQSWFGFVYPVVVCGL